MKNKPEGAPGLPSDRNPHEEERHTILRRMGQRSIVWSLIGLVSVGFSIWASGRLEKGHYSDAGNLVLVFSILGFPLACLWLLQRDTARLGRAFDHSREQERQEDERLIAEYKRGLRDQYSGEDGKRRFRAEVEEARGSIMRAVERLTGKRVEFEKISVIADADMARILREISIEELGRALVLADPEVEKKFISNISDVGAHLILYERELYAEVIRT